MMIIYEDKKHGSVTIISRTFPEITAQGNNKREAIQAFFRMIPMALHVRNFWKRRNENCPVV
jgi:hypothetical protein